MCATHNHTRNPWFCECWQQKFKCLLMVPKDETISRQCTGQRVINAIRVVGYALREMYNDKCHSSRQNVSTASALLNAQFGLPCPEMETINGTILFRYDILNYVRGDHFRLAGDFRQTSSCAHLLRIHQKKLIFYYKSAELPESVCSTPCGIGQRRRQTNACCWTCEHCLETQFLNTATNECHDCPLGEWPDRPT